MYLFRLIHFSGVALLVLMLVGAMVARAQAPAPQDVAADAFWQQLDEQYCYDGDALGAQWDRRNNEVHFALWAPSAGVVSVEIFDIANGNKSLGSGPQPLERDVDTGVWSLALPGAALELASFEGIGYSFIVDGRPALDPYARSMAVTSDPVGIGAIVDPGMTRVSGYARIPAYQRRTDAVIYELSVRDFTSDPTLEPALGGAPFGTFDALRTRLDYVAALGVTHIQLMPVMAWYYGDELAAREREDEWTPKENNYNWGYDPHSWFALDGSYSANPQNPQARIDEFKQLVEAIHQRGMGVILDVVYNHHPVPDILDAIEPGYYYRGRNDSHAGIDIASERCMARKLIVDSLEYWSREFRVDGFRFDLMGLIDARTIREAHARLAQLNPKVLMIGEGWRMYQGPTLQMADQDWVLAQNFAAVFSDDFRDIIKSGFSDEGAPRFVSGGREPVASVLFNLRAEPMKNMRADDPGDVVQYVAAHDNLTLHDVIATALGVDPDRPTAEAEIQRRIRLANTLLLTAQGIAFVHSGQEYGRSKRWRGEEPSPEATTNAAGASFVHNSYDSPDIVNWFDWAAVSGNRESARTTLYTAGLIALRRRTDAFRLGTTESIYRHVQKVETPDISLVDNAVAWQARNSDGSRLMVIVNADSRERVFRLQDDTRDVEVLVDGQRAGSVALSQPVDVRLEQRAVRLAPLTATVLRFPR